MPASDQRMAAQTTTRKTKNSSVVSEKESQIKTGSTKVSGLDSLESPTSSGRSTGGLHSVGELEDVVLEKLDFLVQQIDTKMTKWEQYGAAVVDAKLEAAHRVLDQVRENVIGHPKRRAEEFVRVLEHHRHEMATEMAIHTDTLHAKVTHGMQVLEEMLHKAEDTYAGHAIQAALHSARAGLLTYDQLPDAWQENPYILRGYRFCQNPRECIVSAVHLHNETCNIWTHLAGFFVLLGIGFFHMPYTEAWQQSSWGDRVPMLLFMVAALKCLMCSVSWHTFCNISHLETKQRMACVDYTGITVLIAASILSTEYTVLYCHPVARTAYMALTFASGIGGVMFTWSPSFDTPAARASRVAFFVSFALAGALAGFHAMLYTSAMEVILFYVPVFKSLLCYGIGIIFYALFIPERFLPGSIFDYFGMSHNLWHLCVFGGIYYHYQAIVVLFQAAKQMNCLA